MIEIKSLLKQKIDNETLALAKAALQRMKERENEDINEWAETLAKDISSLAD